MSRKQVENYLNDLFCCKHQTRRTAADLFKTLIRVHVPKSKLIKQSITYRGSVLNNASRTVAFQPQEVDAWSLEHIQNLYHDPKQFNLNNTCYDYLPLSSF